MSIVTRVGDKIVVLDDKEISLVGDGFIVADSNDVKMNFSHEDAKRLAEALQSLLKHQERILKIKNQQSEVR